MKIFAVLLLIVLGCTSEELPVIETGSVQPMPAHWIDKDTGHKLIHITAREGDNRSFYFHNNPFLPASGKFNDKMVFYGREGRGSELFVVDLKTGDTQQITNKRRVSGEIVGVNHREVYYQCGDSVFATGVESKETRLIYVFPDSIRGHITTLNADETLLAGSISTPNEREILRQFPQKGSYFDRIYEAKLLKKLFVIDIEKGELREIFEDHAWLNHIQVSPTDPNL